jgi:hypothetical protein
MLLQVWPAVDALLAAIRERNRDRTRSADEKDFGAEQFLEMLEWLRTVRRMHAWCRASAQLRV